MRIPIHVEPSPAPAIPQLRDYQRKAVDAVSAALADGGVGQLRMACGTGKSVTAQRAAEALLAQSQEGSVVAVVTPSLMLVKQFLDGWRRNAELGPVQCLAVCSDRTVGQGDETASVADLDVEVTTDSDVVKRRLSELPSGELLLIVSTYASAATLAQGVQAAGRPLDVLICDEAHHLAGAPSTHLRNLVMQPEWLPATRRIYMTATPRLYTDRATDRGALSMDDPAFGAITYEYAFPQAIADGHLDDYRALVTVVEDAEVCRALESLNETQDGSRGQEGSDARNTVVAQVALLRSWQEQGVGRAIAFCDSIRGSKAFTAQLRDVASLLGYDPSMVRALHVDGSMSSQERAPILAELGAAPDGRLVVVSNARCLGEGVDVPSVDAVLFACPKRSEVDIIQSAGRALRRSPGGRGVAKFILPMLLPETPGGYLDPNVLDGTDYEPAWTVIRALRDIDNDLGAQLDQLRMSKPGDRTPREGDDAEWDELPGKIAISDPRADPGILRQIAVALIEHTTSPWLDGYAALKAFYDEFGDLDVPPGTKLADGSFLKAWVGRQRRRYRNGHLPADCVAALEALDFDWDSENVEWWRMRNHYAAKAKEYAHDMGGSQTQLGQWIRDQRKSYAAGDLAADRVAALEAIGFKWDSPHVMAQRAAVEEARVAMAWLAEYGCANVPADAVATTAGGVAVNVKGWLSERCRLRHWGELGADEEAALTALGFDWLPPWWRKDFDRVVAIRAQHGDLDVPGDLLRSLGSDGEPLAYWLYAELRQANRGELTPECTAALRSLGIGLKPRGEMDAHVQTEWLTMAALAATHWTENGHINIPLNYRVKADHRYPLYLGCWVQVQRQRKRDEDLPVGWVALLEAMGIDWDVEWEHAGRQPLLSAAPRRPIEAYAQEAA